MELSEIRERIQNTPLVQRLPEGMHKRFVKLLLWLAQTEEVSREEELFTQGDKDTDRGVLLLEGMVRIITEETDKKTIEAPDILGEVQLFTPQGARTATVKVIVGGIILTFKWRELAEEAINVYTDDEMNTLKKVIAESAWTREKDLFDKVKHSMSQ
ncbi:MAG: cyclic nucleotide-binding domain-containing protein [Candidatus Hydrogenedentes bacterium]|nr:cyclic nucleotide-binding domain-containing protein [Candidatus Hydrogenedentota bacterium]